jgi:hypothetical protein
VRIERRQSDEAAADFGIGEAKLSAMLTARWLAALTIAAAVLGACGGSPERSSSRFCSELDQQLPALETLSATATQEELDALVARFDELNEITPLAVEEDWQDLTDLVHTAVTVVPTDPASTQKAADAAYATERAYRRVVDWVSANCGLTMPDPGGIETTTIAPPPESTPAS